MLVLAMLLVACAGARARNFNITYFFIPHMVAPDQHEVIAECQYDANFTLLSWFKGPNEFFRYRPGAAPSTRSFPIPGVETVEMLLCGPTACKLKLGGLTKEATGLYRCDLERDVPPYKYATMTGYMEVHENPQRKPLLVGLDEEYEEGDMIKACCRASPNSQLRWYINGKELTEFRGSLSIKKMSNQHLYIGVPPTMVVQCVEFKYGRAYGSTQQSVKLTEGHELRQKKKECVKSESVAITGHLGLLSIVCLLDKVFYV